MHCHLIVLHELHFELTRFLHSNLIDQAFYIETKKVSLPYPLILITIRFVIWDFLHSFITIKDLGCHDVFLTTRFNFERILILFSDLRFSH